MEQLIDDVVDHILERLPVKSLIRFKSVSKKWKSTVETSYFMKRHLICRQSHDPNVLIINSLTTSSKSRKGENVTRMFTMDPSPELITLPNLCPSNLTISLRNQLVESCHYSVTGICDGMICHYNEYNCIYMVNPITRWSRSVPQARYQHLSLEELDDQIIWKGEKDGGVFWRLGFGKDKFTDTYKLVWLYNSFELGLEDITTCEVFDFRTNAWRYVTGSPFRVLDNQIPLYFDGSIHWFTDEHIGETTKILSFDLHTETFHIMLETPFVVQAEYIRICLNKIIMCELDNRLCVSRKEWPKQEIWSLNNSNMTWEKIYSLKLKNDFKLFNEDEPFVCYPYCILCVIPVAVLKDRKKSLMLYDPRAKNPNLVIYDPESRTYRVCLPHDYKIHYTGMATSYFPSLISIV
ncbi:unnamed protein product [Cochlearia groenlandica]